MMNKPTPPLWLPDWTDDNAYPTSYDDWSLSRWCWAFLRRNAEYQSDYARYASIPAWLPECGKTPKLSGRGIADDESMAYRYCDPPALVGETSYGYWQRNRGNVIEEMPLEAHLMGKWCIGHVIDPADDNGWTLITFEVDMPPYRLQIDVPDGSGWIPPAPDSDWQESVTLRFDVRFNIDRQIEEAKAILNDHLDNMKNGLFAEIDGGFDRIRSATPAKEKLPVYLRAFDACSMGVGPRELAGKICPSKRNTPSSLHSADGDASRAIKAGKSLVDMGYKDLLKFG